MNIIKENNKEYAVIPAGEGKKDFTERMVLENRIPGLLPVSAREFNGEASYYFDTTGRRAFSDSFRNENDFMGVPDVEALCESVIKVSRSVVEYLLDIDDIDLKPETLFFEPETGLYGFVYIPGRSREERETGDFRSGLRLVWERVLKKFCRDADRDFLMKLYDIYQKMTVDNFDPETVFDIKQKERPAETVKEVKPEPELKEEDLYDKEKIEEIIEKEEKEEKAPGKRKIYAMYGGMAAAAIIALAVVI